MGGRGRAGGRLARDIGAEVYSGGLPSGHSKMAAVVRLTVAAPAASSGTRAAAEAWIMGIAFPLAVTVALNRDHPGVNRSSDVPALWARHGHREVARWSIS